MIQKIYYKYVITIVIGLIFTHLFWSYFLGSLTSYFYNKNLINVRNYEAKEQIFLTQAYLNQKLKSPGKPIMLILGSSFSYGYDLLAKETYTHFMAKYFPNYTILNASRIGESGQDILTHINYLKTHKIHLDTLIVEINLFNFTASSYSITQDKNKHWFDFINNSYSHFYLLHPHGINLLTNLELNRLYAPDKKMEHQYSFASLPDSYSEKYSDFKRKLPNYTAFLNSLFSSSSAIADHVYFFVSPIYKNGIKQTQFKVSDIHNELEDIHQICKKFSKIHCLTPSFNYSKNNFMNLSHFNEQGHRVLAKWLSEQISKTQNHQITTVELNKQVS
ncbi:TPA: hypothetical protein I8Y86_001958 [Legionella pneumophila]|uniref:DUF1574 domain-containing protein n=1 Tax=Legionella pneumophila subsp. pascullei TaxID=91890 RepID=A0AAX2IUT3_LEGPN|nr:hypothetical protein [Legionella pneumophila]HAT9634652.1 hypothetical protein [Legionella pneumophila subsp. pneumophila]AMP91820.1 hypothetical protein AXF36_04065 [Legionella pneumophila subsp. pascullei]APF05632.1 hypothetical protein BIZ51_04305 [Legionella pneumophila subsp. fraseri]SQG89638.1 Uncharacterised protein [Legionella pneumophila subsp. pascullei]VEH05108.1 Uncharacterised protein [Legionella pneumophila subsp. pascullei]